MSCLQKTNILWWYIPSHRYQATDCTSQIAYFGEEKNASDWDDKEKGRWLFDRFVEIYFNMGCFNGDSEIPFNWCVLCNVYTLHPILCLKCQQQPCIVYQDKIILKEVINMNVVECWFLMYKEFTRRLHGYLGSKYMCELPHCFKHFTHKVFPEKDGCYVGYTGSMSST